MVKICQGLGVSGAWCQRGVGDQQGCWQSAACFLQHTAPQHITCFARNAVHTMVEEGNYGLDVQEGNKQTAIKCLGSLSAHLVCHQEELARSSL